ncbi:glycosyltransferase family 9 protein [Desulfomonile tiedjei]|uniref:ADP-heptose:LPS heptosyltransferase n=1 Tax=Desulfomonile tiedjei (strain ATCC 49306 / DSM 6799 / DCB-1) TaxID=706587 RepID=I4C2X5_DESTA|nr:glycosyltransferase family 9 protein [Desulfomonile tiedjei]AFM23916.1 ADP-heptose:LPS heptosyltransferase [Desulfomonile tiedjei DSM 6799]
MTQSSLFPGNSVHGEILVIRSGALGDTILTLPLLFSIEKAHPGSQVLFLGNRSYKDLIPQRIRFGAIDGREWEWLFSPEPKVSAQSRGFEKAYVILNRPEDVVRNLKIAGTDAIAHTGSHPPPGRHIVVHLHESLGFEIPAKQPLFQHSGKSDRPFIWIHPGSGGPRKCVPLAAVVDLVQRLKSATGLDVVVTSSEDDAFLKESADWHTLVSLPGVTLVEGRGLSELMTSLGGALLFMGNDSGISHFAANLGIRSVVFFVASDPNQWAPWVPSSMLNIINLRNQQVDKISWRERATKTACALLLDRVFLPSHE